MVKEELEKSFDDWFKKIEEPYKDSMDKKTLLAEVQKKREGKITYFFVIIVLFLMQSLSKVLLPVLYGEIPLTFEIMIAIFILVLGVIGYSFGGKLLQLLDMKVINKRLNNAEKFFTMQVEKREKEREDWEWRRKKELQLDTHIKSERRTQEKFDNAIKLRGTVYNDLIFKTVGGSTPPPEIPESLLDAVEKMDANLFIGGQDVKRVFEIQAVMEKIEQQTTDHYELSKKNREEILRTNELNTKVLIEIKDLWKEINMTRLVLQQHNLFPVVDLDDK